MDDGVKTSITSHDRLTLPLAYVSVSVVLSFNWASQKVIDITFVLGSRKWAGTDDSTPSVPLTSKI